MSGLFPGDVFPADLEIQHLPPGSKPVAYAASKEFEGRKVVLVSFPGAFTGPCSQTHLPGFVANMDKFRASGIDKIAIVAYNDAYVMNAWKKDHGITGDFMVFLSDTGTTLAKQVGCTKGERAGRFALVIEDGRILYVGTDASGEIRASSAEEVLKFLEQK